MNIKMKEKDIKNSKKKIELTNLLVSKNRQAFKPKNINIQTITVGKTQNYCNKAKKFFSSKNLKQIKYLYNTSINYNINSINYNNNYYQNEDDISIFNSSGSERGLSPINSNNISSYKNTSFNTKKQNKNLKFNSKTYLKPNTTKANKINYQNPKLTLQKEALKPKNIKIKNNNDTNKNINKSKYRLFSSGTQNLENKKNLNKNKKNNVTNNICIIIKTSNHKEPEEDKTLHNFRYYDSLKNILNYPMTTGHFGAKNLKQNYSFKNQRTYNEKKVKYNNSFTRRSSKSEKEKKKEKF